MPLPRHSDAPPATVDPRLALLQRRARTQTPKSESATLEGSSTITGGGSVGPDRTAASEASKLGRSSNTPYSRSHPSSSRAPSAYVPQSMYARGDAGLVFCGSCQQFQPQRLFGQTQLSKARRRPRRATQEQRELKLHDFPKCDRCVVPQATELKCVDCGERRPAGSFSSAMRANPRGATCKPCQRVAADPKDTMRREDIEADAFAAYSSSEDGDDDDLLVSGSVGGRSTAAGFPSTPGSAQPPRRWNADEAYGVAKMDAGLTQGGAGAGGGGPLPVVVCDDDDDEWD